MAENGPAGMYKVQPLYDSLRVFNLPSCMYKLDNVHGDSPDMETKEHSSVSELENYQIQVLKKLDDLKSDVLELKNALGIPDKPIKFQDIVISASPEFPPLSIWALYYLMSQKVKVCFATHIHSSLIQVPEIVKLLKVNESEGPHILSLRIIWKHVTEDSMMMIDPVNQGTIEGEVNIARYIARLMKLNYDEDPISSTQVDNWLEMAHSYVIHGNSKERQATLRSMNSHLGCNSFLVGNEMSIADIVMWSVIIQAKLQGSLPANVNKWWKALNSLKIFQVPSAVLSS